ncbi:hypothetical protein ACLRGA_20220 [Acinetobacter baumannii]|uniref:hypothetical protein n=1 Tax=Acinetobacter baumannii TaxID=470 RepID=UPI0039A44E0A
MATALTSQYTRFTDKCNRVLAGGVVKTFEPNSLIPKITYQDPLATIPNLPEVVLDSTGRARIYLLGDYRVQIYSNDGTLIEDNLYVDQGVSQTEFLEVNKTLIANVDSLEDLEEISNVWDGRTIYVKDLGNYRYDALTTSWVKAYQDADNVKDGAETQKQINDAQRLLNSKIIQIIESVDALRQFKPKQDGQAVYLKSHAIGKNKGGGIFLYSATSTALDNNGTIISCVDGGAFLRQYDTKNGYFEWFGAQCDGVTDDTASVIAALKVLKVIHFSNKIKLTQPIDIDPFKVGQTLGITITGDGTESSYLEFYGCNFGFYSASDTFFRDLNFKAFQIKNADNNQVGIGVYIGSSGAEQINISSVTYRGWKFGRATHTWNSGFEKEVFRLCSYPYAMYGTSSNVNAPYAVSCPGPYLIGYAVSSTGTISIPAIPYAYSTISSHAADDCGQDGSIFKFGRCAGIDALTMGGERAKGQYIYDFSELVPSSAGQVIVEGYDVYINSAFTTIVGVAKSPNVAFGTLVFNNTRISTDKEIWLLSGDGNGVAVNNAQMNNRAFSRLTELPANGLLLDGVAIGSDYRESGELGFSFGANGIVYPRVKMRKGKALIDPTTQKLVLFCGSLSEGLPQGNLMSAIITAMPVNKGGNNAAEKVGQLFVSSAMDYNATDMTGHLKVFRTGTLTTATTVSRNTSNANILQFDINFEVTNPATRFLLDIDLSFNGISNVNGLAWQVVAK